MTMPSLFTKIINGEIPGYRIFENERVFSFLNIRPIHPGHALVIPKREVDYVLNVEDEDYLEVFRVAKIIGKAVQASTDCKRVLFVVAGFEVPHFHLHLIPAWDISDTNFSKQREAKPEDLASMQQRIRKNLEI